MRLVRDENLPDLLLTVKDVAEILSVGVRTVWRWTAAGEIPQPIKLGRSTVRWRASEIQRYIDLRDRSNGQPHASTPGVTLGLPEGP